MIVIGERSAKYRRYPVSRLFADDPAELAHGRPHRRQRGLQPQHGILGVELLDQVRRPDKIRPEDGNELSLAVGSVGGGGLRRKGLCDRLDGQCVPAIDTEDVTILICPAATGAGRSTQRCTAV